VASIIEYFNPALWGAWFKAGVDQLGYTAFWLAVGQILGDQCAQQASRAGIEFVAKGKSHAVAAREIQNK